MTYGEAIVAVLRGNSTVTGLVGTGSDARIYAGLLPVDAARPAITYRFSGGPGESFVADGPGEGIEAVRLELNAWASGQTEARQVAKAMRDALHGWRGWQGTAEIQLISCEGASDIPEPESGLYRTTFFAEATFTTR